MISIQSTCNDSELEADVDADIAAFDEYFRSLGNDPLVKFEKAIIKTYLHRKLKGVKDGTQASG